MATKNPLWRNLFDQFNKLDGTHDKMNKQASDKDEEVIKLNLSIKIH